MKKLIFRKFSFQNMDKITRLVKGPWSYSRLRCLRTIKRNISNTPVTRYKWEPDGLKLEPDIAEYAAVNIKLQGYDFAVLESYNNYVKKMANSMKMDIESWPVPAQKLKIQSLQFSTVKVLQETDLNIYERVIQLQNLPSVELPLFLEMIWNCVPEGVNVTVKESTEEEEDFIYIPDHQKRKVAAALEEILDTRRK